MSYTPGVPSGLHRALMRNSFSPKVDEVFGEFLLIQPMHKPRGQNSQSERDTTRKRIKVAGVFRSPRLPEEISQGAPSKLNIALDKPCFSIALASLPYPLKIGDCIIRQTGEWYEVKAVKADALKIRGEVEVVELGVQPGLGGSYYDQS